SASLGQNGHATRNGFSYGRKWTIGALNAIFAAFGASRAQEVRTGGKQSCRTPGWRSWRLGRGDETKPRDQIFPLWRQIATRERRSGLSFIPGDHQVVAAADLVFLSFPFLLGNLLEAVRLPFTLACHERGRRRELPNGDCKVSRKGNVVALSRAGSVGVELDHIYWKTIFRNNRLSRQER